jgi:hypothetical protein
MFPYCKSWIKYHKWNLYEYFLSGIKFQIVVHRWSLFHPWNIVKFNPGKFIDWKFTNDISWMLIHNMEYCLLSYFVEFISLMSQVHFAKSWSQFELTILPNEWQSPHLLNCEVDVAKSPSGDGSFPMILWYHWVTGYLLQFWDNYSTLCMILHFVSSLQDIITFLYQFIHPTSTYTHTMV